jgi:protein-L-isoaspartate(D-aspartate) O-methyltransferase
MAEELRDTFRHKGLRKILAEKIREKGISDERVIEAINKVPRHLFLDSSFEHFAYKDQAFPISAGQTISQPYTVAFQTSLLQVKKNEKVLEIGTGSGYQAAILVEMGAIVYTIERHRELFLQAQALLPKLGYFPHFFYGDGYNGLPAYSPFDKIIITAACREIPPKLIEQLKVGGRLVAPVGDNNVQKMCLIEKTSEENIKKTNYGEFVFVPLLPGTAS